jgi:hypothetical protein
MVAPAAALGADCINLPVCCCFDPLFLHAIHTLCAMYYLVFLPCTHESCPAAAS